MVKIEKRDLWFISVFFYEFRFEFFIGFFFIIIIQKLHYIIIIFTKKSKCLSFTTDKYTKSTLTRYNSCKVSNFTLCIGNPVSFPFFWKYRTTQTPFHQTYVCGSYSCTVARMAGQKATYHQSFSFFCCLFLSFFNHLFFNIFFIGTFVNLVRCSK